MQIFHIGFTMKRGQIMDQLITICSRMYTLQRLPLSLVDGKGRYLHSWPETYQHSIRPEMSALVIQDFILQGRDPLHPLISLINKGFFFGVLQIHPDLYLIIGLVSPYRHSRQELMEMCVETVFPEQMQRFCDDAMQAPVLTLQQMRAYVAVLTQLFSGENIPEDNILFDDIESRENTSEKNFSTMQFRQREDLGEHTKLGYENAFRQAIRIGRSDLLMKALASSAGGSVGVMSLNELRQRKFMFISLATLVSRAAMEGGLPEETAYLLSDLYCQKMDMLQSQSDFDRLSIGMAMDFCDKVAKNKLSEHVSPIIRKALNYISVHLHEPISVEDLAAHCGLCRRSLSIRFKKEMGLGIVDYIQQEKITEARFLLDHTNLSLPQISAHLNYSSQSYFTVQFKKIIGETPERYRNRPKNN